jgi:sugar phosphate isomerase/epimerase
MNIGLSNFAFDNTDLILLESLSKSNINNIELVFTKHKSWDYEYNDLLEIKNFFKNLNLNISSIQSIFYNTNINSFSQTIEIKEHLKKLFIICSELNINSIIFGSPIFRKEYNKNQKYIKEIFDFIEFELSNTKIKFLIEPNSKIYNTEYFYNPHEIFNFININKYKNVSTMIDTHNLLLEGYNPISILENNFKMIDHIHISEYNLSELKNIEFHIKFSEKLKELNYNGFVIFEIFKNENINKNIKEFYEIYR